MTKSNRSKTGSPEEKTGKSLKEQNRWQLWIIIAANWIFFYGVVKSNTISTDGLRAAFTDPKKLVPVGLALVIATVLNGFLSPDMKARLVFLRLHHALPGHRAFTKYAVRDPRIDLSALKKLHGGILPVDPVEQNRVWYRIYKTMENDPAVRQVHRDSLLMRDYTGLSAIFLVFYGAVGLYAIPSIKTGVVYFVVLAGQYILAQQAAFNYGVRLVTTVLARSAAKEGVDSTKAPRKDSLKSADTPKN